MVNGCARPGQAEKWAKLTGYIVTYEFGNGFEIVRNYNHDIVFTTHQFGFVFNMQYSMVFNLGNIF